MVINLILTSLDEIVDKTKELDDLMKQENVTEGRLWIRNYDPDCGMLLLKVTNNTYE